MALVDSQKEMKNLLPFNSECGTDYGHYNFMQGDSEVVIRVPLAENTPAKSLAIQIETQKLSVGFKKGGETPIISGKLFKPIKADDSTWCIEDKKLLVITLCKSNREYEEWWPCVVEGEPQCDFKTLVPPSKHMKELDQGAQAQIHKMMFDQEQKRKGAPTSDELVMKEQLAKGNLPPQAQQQFAAMNAGAKPPEFA